MVCTLISALVMSMVYLINKAHNEVGLEAYGLKAQPINILAALCVAVLAFAAGYGLVFAVDAIFKTDFRLWVFAFKTFEPSVPPAILHYLPIFFLYYLISSIAICINTNTQSLQGDQGVSAGHPAERWRHHPCLWHGSTSPCLPPARLHTPQALSAILLFGMIPTLAIAACYSPRTGQAHRQCLDARFL